MLFAERYKIITYLGSGASANVAKAQDEKTGQIIALKIISLKKISEKEQTVQNFGAEFETLKNLDHPHIAKIYDAGFDETQNKLYLASELIEGSDLFEATEKLSFAERELLFIQALRALNYLHEQGVLHLDIKPQNILVTLEPSSQAPILKLIDFGLANFYQRSQGAKEGKHQIIGTAAYTAPEIIQGQHPDGRSDLYSLGISFFKVFTRRLPFGALTTEEAHQAQIEETFPSLSSLVPSLPPYIDTIFSKLLAKNPNNRYATGADVIGDLSLLSGHPIAVETSETILSYIPEQGTLVARKEQIETVENIFKGRILEKDFNLSPSLIISGKEGTGKTRVISEIRNLAKKNLVKVMSLDDFRKTSISEIKPPVVILADDNKLDKVTHQIISLVFALKPVLVVSTTLDFKSDIAGTSVHLEYFTLEETSSYLMRATGISNLPPETVQLIYSHTQGNPAFLSEYVRNLFEKGVLRDKHGSWSIKILDDIGMELGKNSLTVSIKARLKKQLHSLSLDEAQWDILNILALTGKPTIVDLMELSQPSSINSDLEMLVAANIIVADGANYHFTNPLYAEIIAEMMAPTDTETRSDKIADYLEKQGADKGLVLYHRGHGKTEKAIEALLQLSQLKQTQFLFDDSINALESLLKKIDVTSSHYFETAVNLAELYIETGQLKKTSTVLENILCEINKSTNPLLQAKALDAYAITCQRNRQFDTAENYFNQALECIQNNPQLTWMTIVIQNHIGRLEYDRGNVDLAIQIMETALVEWEKLPDENNKIKAMQTDLDMAYILKSEFLKAATMLEKQLAFVSNKPDTSYYPVLLYKLGSVYFRMNQEEKGEKLLKNCLGIMKNRHVVYWLYVVYNELGNHSMKLKKWDDALGHYEHAFNLSLRQTKGIEPQVIAYNMANLYCETGNLDAAEKYFNYVKITLQQSKADNDTQINFHIMGSLLGLASVSRKKGELSEASQFIDEAEKMMASKNYLSQFKQFFLQEKADLAKAINNPQEETLLLKRLDEMKNNPGFNPSEHQNWLDMRS